jgi:hypothetical protein
MQNKGSASGFDNTAEQECQNMICTHPGENATCTQEGVRSIPTPEPTTTTLRIIKKLFVRPQILIVSQIIVKYFYSLAFKAPEVSNVSLPLEMVLLLHCSQGIGSL